MTNIPSPAQGTNKLYFTAWRWHFYAGLYVVPFLLMLAITGFFMMLLTTYLPEYGDRLAVAQGKALSIEVQTAAAIAAVDGGTGAREYITPYGPKLAARVTVTGGPKDMVVAIDPNSGAILRQTPEGETWNAFFETLHGSLMMGRFGDILIEIAAGLGLVLVTTGLYLVWPRGRSGAAMFIPDLRAKGRAWWKSLHQVFGTWVAIFLTLFLLTGMAWSSVWGTKWVQAWNTFPAQKWNNVPLSNRTHDSLNLAGEKAVPWTLEQTPMPMSGSLAGQTVLPKGTAMTFDSAAELGRAIGLTGRFHIQPPDGETGVWTLSKDTMSRDGSVPTLDRTVHVDQYTGKILADVHFGDYSVGAQAMAVGISLHEGQIGLWNFALNMLILLMIIFMCVSGIVLWWKRRPAAAARLAAPPKPTDMPLWKGALAIAVVLSVLFPLVGAVLIGVAVLDLLVVQNLPKLKRILS